MAKFLIVSFVLLYWVCCKADDANCTYTIVSPKVIKPGRLHQFSVTTVCPSHANFTLKAWITGERQKVIKIKTGITKLFSIAIPKWLTDKEYFFHVEGSDGLTFSENRSVIVSKKQHSILIQTDKAVYKPGDRVLFRVLILNPDLKPSRVPINVTINDPRENQIYQSLNVRGEKGVISGQLPLSKITIFGTWTVTAKSKSGSNNYRFEVKEYVLPKFKVELTVPTSYHVNVNNRKNQEDLSIMVAARYTYDQPVKGIAYFSITHNSYLRTRGMTPSVSKVLKLENGMAGFEVKDSELLNLIPCFYGEPSLEYQTFEVEVNVTEQITAITLSSKKSVSTHSDKFRLRISTGGNYFKPGFPFQVMFTLKQHNGDPVLLSDLVEEDGTSRSIAVKISLGVGDSSSTTLDREDLVSLMEDGRAHMTVEQTSNIKHIHIQAAFYDDYSNITMNAYASAYAFQTKNSEYIQLDLQTPETVVEADKPTTFLVRTSKAITTFRYQVFAKDFLHISQEVTGDNSTLHSFVINATKDLAANLAPEVLVMVSYVDNDGELVADGRELKVVNYFHNKVGISFSKETVRPSDTVTLSVNASEGSLVALLAVDHSVRLLKTGNDITEDEIIKDLYGYRRINSWALMDDVKSVPVQGQDTKGFFENAGVILITNNYVHKIVYESIHTLETDSLARGGLTPHRSHESRRSKSSMHLDDVSHSLESDFEGNSEPHNQPRTDFPETWIWTDLNITENGITEMTFKVPDTITSFIATAFSTNEILGFGVSNPAEIRVFKSMFLSLKLPTSVTRGEEFALVVTLFNYLDTDLDVDISLARSEHFKTRKCESANLVETFDSDEAKSIKVQSKDSEGVYFWIVPTTLGLIPIEVTGSAGANVDIVKTTILVKPEGQPQSYSMSRLLESQPLSQSTVSFPVSLPSDVVAGSAVIEVSVVGNIFATTIKNLQKLVGLPAGCGEQNIINFAPNVYILNFLSAADEVSGEEKDRMNSLLQAGFLQQLTFQRRDGSYSAFGDKDPEGSVWLSAFVIKSFRHAKPYVTYDAALIIKTLRWILQYQNEDGSFSEPPGGKVIHSMMQGGSSSGVTLTAYVLIALQENKFYRNKVKILEESIRNATRYLEGEYESHSNNSYVLSLITYSFQLVNKSTHFNKAFRMLQELAVRTGNTLHWKAEARTPAQSRAWMPFYEKPLSYDIEATSYALLTYKAQRNNESLLIAKWLIEQRNEAGGFRSTQDTVIALEALSKFAQSSVETSVEDGLDVYVEDDVTDTRHQISKITKENAFLLQTVELHGNTTEARIVIEGRGTAAAQLSVRYNTRSPLEHPQLSLNLSTRQTKDQIVLSVTTSWLGEDDSGMVIIEIELLTGWELEGKDQMLEQLGSAVDKLEDSDSKVLLYLHRLTSLPLNFEMTLKNKLFVFGVQPALVKVYRYYEPDSVASAFYSAQGRQTWLTSCPECCA